MLKSQDTDEINHIHTIKEENERRHQNKYALTTFWNKPRQCTGSTFTFLVSHFGFEGF